MHKKHMQIYKNYAKIMQENMHYTTNMHNMQQICKVYAK